MDVRGDCLVDFRTTSQIVTIQGQARESGLTEAGIQGSVSGPLLCFSIH